MNHITQKHSAITQLPKAKWTAKGLDKAYTSNNNLIIPVHFSPEDAGFYALSAQLYDGQKPIAQLQADGLQPLKILASINYSGAGGGTELADLAISVAYNDSWYNWPLKAAVQAFTGITPQPGKLGEVTSENGPSALYYNHYPILMNEGATHSGVLGTETGNVSVPVINTLRFLVQPRQICLLWFTPHLITNNYSVQLTQEEIWLKDELSTDFPVGIRSLTAYLF